MLKEIPCQIFRGGTSKGVFIRREDLPADMEEWEPILLKIMGSPDPKQIDGLGGSFSTTSKVAVIAKAANLDYDITYTFAQVAVDRASVSFAGNCGNISSAVGPYAIENNLVEVSDPYTVVRILNTNTNKILHEIVPTPGGQITYEGDCLISGVPTPGARLELKFLTPGGAVTGRLLPTGHTVDTLDVLGVGRIEMSIVDASNPLAFVRAEDIGMRGTELPTEVAGDSALLAKLEKIRGVAAQACGLIADYRDSLKSPTVPKLTIISRPQDYCTAGGVQVFASQQTITSRMMSMQKMHNSYAFTGALCTAAAAAIPGTIVQEITGSREEITIGHADGLITAGVQLTDSACENEKQILNAYGIRTARKLMAGTAFY